MFSVKETKIILEESKKLNKGWSVRINRNMRNISCHIPIVIIEMLDEMVKEGRYISRSEAIRSILRDSKEMKWNFD